jgi:hypothetical protein
MESTMNLPRRLAVLTALALLSTPALPCSAFVVCGDDHVLFANNEDYWDCNTRVWFVPASEGRHGVMYLGYANLFPQGALNDAGLAYDGFATAPYPLTQQAGKEAFEGNLIKEAIETCATVEEVVALLERYDLSSLANAMLFFADASGDAVIVEGDVFLRKQGEFQVVTNFYQSRQADDLAQCPRFASATRLLQARQETSLDLCRRVLATTAQESGAPTQYSNVFDLQARRIWLYHFHNFEAPVALDLDEELAKGERVLVLPELFEPTFAYRSFVQRSERERAQKTAARRGPGEPVEKLDEYAGRYRLEVPGQDPREFSFRRDGVRLLLAAETVKQLTGEDEIEVVPEAQAAFFLIQPQGTFAFRFTRDEAGSVDGVTIVSEGGEMHAERLGD